MASQLLYLILALPVIITLLMFLHRYKHKQTSSSHLPPGPPGLPLIGNLFDIDSSAPHRSLWRLSQVYGTLMSLKLGRTRVLVVSSARMAEEVMKTHDLVFCSRPSLTGSNHLSYDRLDVAFAPYDAYWREIRKICVVHLFNSNRVQSFCPIREGEVNQMIERISRYISYDSKPFNLSESMLSMTSTIICRTAFGKSLEGNYGADMRSKLDLMLRESGAMFTGFFFSDHFPSLGFLDRFTGMMVRLKKNRKELDDFYQDIIDEHLNPKRAESAHKDVLDVLLGIMKEGPFKVQLTVDHIKGILMNIFIAGTDTSAATVVWAMAYLMKNPTTLRKAQEEVRQVIEKKGFVKEEDIERLPYLKAVVKETMRLQPAAPLLLPRESSQDCYLNGYKIPGKTTVYVNAWAIGRDPEAWGENTEEFKPERFMQKSIDMKGADFGLIPFGAGRRMCPGIHMGLVTVELSLANLLYAFDWEMPVGTKREDLDMEVSPGLTMHKKNALWLGPKKCVCL
ncbi:unnamed protein product [Linum trigynum]|uniref:Cytochrome P450 n=1 Tax=Linum trigynum TaxID=586398 RepID=A0AAV2D5L8_9ROSI